ncbi:MAG: thiamine-phosphate kinase [Chitinophagales bacterium]
MTKRTEIATLGEFGLIEKLTKDFSLQNNTIKGVGDDAAVLKNEAETTIVSTDLLIEGVHFDLAYVPLKHLGYKSVVVNLSDIYAMNATPKQITISLAISNRFSVEALEVFYEGVKAACDFYKVDMVGGDTTSSLSGLMISVTAVGVANEKDLVYRNGAKEGDFICVSGDLGAAYTGLQVLNREKQVYMEDKNMQPDLKKHEYIVGRQLKPEARKDIVAYFKEYEIVPTAMIDVSDGLSSELMHITTQSKVGCHIYEAHVPIKNETYNQALEFNIDPITCALNGGEDYELLFTIDKKDEHKINEAEIDITVIGKVVGKEKGCVLQSRSNQVHPLIAQGWNPIKE